MRPASRLPRLLIVLLATSLLAGCGGSDEPTAATDRQAVEIKGRFGTATIETPPKRVVALDYAAADGAFALGVVPVAAPLIAGLDRPSVWQRDALGDRPAPETLAISDAIPFERVASYRPDVILATDTFALDADAYAKLSRIAPTVHFAREPLGEPWQDTTLRIGRALGREDAAREQITATEGRLSTAREQLAPLRGKTFNAFLASADGVGVITDPDDALARVFATLGLELDPQVQALEEPGGRGVVLSDERVDLLDADVVVGSAVTAPELRAAEREPVFAGLPAVRQDRYVGLDFETFAALTVPSAASLDWVVDDIAARIAATAR